MKSPPRAEGKGIPGLVRSFVITAKAPSGRIRIGHRTRRNERARVASMVRAHPPDRPSALFGRTACRSSRKRNSHVQYQNDSLCDARCHYWPARSAHAVRICERKERAEPDCPERTQRTTIDHPVRSGRRRCKQAVRPRSSRPNGSHAACQAPLYDLRRMVLLKKRVACSSGRAVCNHSIKLEIRKFIQ